MSKEIQALAVLPVRYGSRRLPAKPLLKAAGKYLFQHVYERVKRAKELNRVVIATDDERIMQACKEVGAEAMMTSPEHPSGTDRVAEIAQRLDMPLVLNVQGDEAEIPPEDIDALVRAMRDNPLPEMGTLAAPLALDQPREHAALVKVVTDGKGYALYFSRSPIPYFRDPETPLKYIQRQTLGHIGVYAFRREYLMKFTKMPVSPLEDAEKLEQLRALEDGARILVVRASTFSKGVDTQEDFDAFRQRCEGK